MAWKVWICTCAVSCCPKLPGARAPHDGADHRAAVVGCWCLGDLLLATQLCFLYPHTARLLAGGFGVVLRHRIAGAARAGGGVTRLSRLGWRRLTATRGGLGLVRRTACRRLRAAGGAGLSSGEHRCQDEGGSQESQHQFLHVCPPSKIRDGSVCQSCV